MSGDIIEIVTNETGAVWFVHKVTRKTIMYVSEDGALHVPGDVIALALDTIPPPPSEKS